MAGWKKINPADLRDDPPVEEGKLTPTDRQADYSFARLSAADPDRFIREIKGMLVGDEYEYAEQTLRGILQTVEHTRVVTQGQWTAVDNIAGRPHQHTPRARSRRGY